MASLRASATTQSVSLTDSIETFEMCETAIIELPLASETLIEFYMRNNNELYSVRE
jgi:hypothetical protein